MKKITFFQTIVIMFLIAVGAIQWFSIETLRLETDCKVIIDNTGLYKKCKLGEETKIWTKGELLYALSHVEYYSKSKEF